MSTSPVVEEDRADARARAPQLARELSVFLIELAIAMHKHAIYPPGHPLLVQTVDAVYGTLLELLAVRPTLSIGVARRQLIIEGVATESGHPLLSELAGKLHRHHIGAVKLMRGVTRDELSDALAAVGVEPRRDDVPLGLTPEKLERRWTGVHLFPLTYDRLELVDDEPEADEMRGGRAAQLWVGLARAAMAGERALDDGVLDAADASLEPAAVARAIDEHSREQAYDQVIVGYMLQIADEARQNGAAEGAALRRRISRLVGELQPETLRRLLDMGGDAVQRRRFVLDAAQAMNVDAVVELVQAAAKAEGQTISHSLVRMLTKLASHATDTDTRRGHAADGALREHVMRLIGDWSLDDPNPAAYSAMLERMARSAEPGEVDAECAYPCEPARVLEIAFAIDVGGDAVIRAATAMRDAGDTATLLDILETNAVAAPRVAAAVWRVVNDAVPLPTLLAAPRLDTALVDRLVAMVGLSALPALLEALLAATQPSRREQLAQRIASLGPAAVPLLAERLREATGATARELLALIARLAPPAPPREARAFLTDADPQLRREAVRLLAKYGDTRDGALLAAVRDADDTVLAAGLRAAQDGCSVHVAHAVRQRLGRDEIGDDVLCAAAVRAVAASATPGRADDATVEWLASRVLRPARMMRGPRIGAPTSELCAALSLLATRWAGDRRVSSIVELAAINTSPAIRQAASGTTAALPNETER